MSENESAALKMRLAGDARGIAARCYRKSAAGRDAMLQADVAAGAPTNADGTFNLVHYAAWLVKEMGRGD